MTKTPKKKKKCDCKYGNCHICRQDAVWDKAIAAEKKQTGNGYWVQTIYAVIAPDGSAEDYYYTKKEAVRNCQELNRPSKS